MATEKRTVGGWRLGPPVTPGASCIAPIDENAPDPHLCGAPATTTRLVEDLVCALCEAHAAEIDEEQAREREEPTTAPSMQ